MTDQQPDDTVWQTARLRVIRAFNRLREVGIETHGQPLPVSVPGMDMAEERLYELVDAIIYETAELMQREQLRAELEAEQHINRQLARNVLEAQAERDRYKAAVEKWVAAVNHHQEVWDGDSTDVKAWHIRLNKAEMQRMQAEDGLLEALAGSSDAWEARYDKARLETFETYTEVLNTRKERDRYKWALEFYADEKTYHCTPWADGLGGMSRIDKDYGAQARAALAGSSDAGGAP